GTVLIAISTRAVPPDIPSLASRPIPAKVSITVPTQVAVIIWSRVGTVVVAVATGTVTALAPVASVRLGTPTGRRHALALVRPLAAIIISTLTAASTARLPIGRQFPVSLSTIPHIASTTAGTSAGLPRSAPAAMT